LCYDFTKYAYSGKERIGKDTFAVFQEHLEKLRE
jgi:hypothetical protein